MVSKLNKDGSVQKIKESAIAGTKTLDRFGPAKHDFYSRDSEGYWMVKCVKTTGTFSTRVWSNFMVKSQMCPCCGESVTKD